MISRLIEARKKDEGFTLIELLVVIIIIGILAAIAIPVFLNQRQKGWDSAVKSDLRNAATAEETVLTETGTYTASMTDLTTAGFKYSAASNYANNSATITATVGNPANSSYCLQATSASTKIFSYSSPAGLTQGPCP
jgi:type IV pilus assembly protein PilA